MPTTPPVVRYEILYVEDNPGDVRLMQEALSEHCGRVLLVPARDADEALARLHGRGVHQDARLPSLIFLDLNLPRMDGLELLRELKQDTALRRIPVIVMTSGDLASRRIAAYDAYANCCVNKPVDLTDYLKLIRAIGAFWFDVARLPTAVAAHSEHVTP